MTTALYLRISDDREGKELGVERQREDCLALAERHGLSSPTVYADNDRGASTRSRKARPEFMRMIADARAGRVTEIIAYTSGRLTRRPRESEDLIELAEQHGVRFLYVASPVFDLNTSAGRRIARYLAVNDAGEAEDISERVQREVRQRAEQGREHGGPTAYGYTGKGQTVIPDEAANVRRWIADVTAGRSLSSVAREAGRSRSAARVILTNPRYAGLRILNGIEYRGSSPAIVDVTEWRAVCAVLADPRRKQTTASKARRWLGSSLFLCERCSGRTVGSYQQKASTGDYYPSYRCRPADGGCSRAWKAAPLDDWVTDLVTERLGREDLADLMPVARPDDRPLLEEAKEIRRRMNRLATVYATGTMTDADMDDATEAARARLDEIDRLTAPDTTDSTLRAVLDHHDPVAAWLAIPAENVAARQSVVRGLMTVTLGAPPRGRVPFNPEAFVGVDWNGAGTRLPTDTACVKG